MAKILSGAEKALQDVFCDKYDFVIPPYQRPYAWTEKETGELFDDLFAYCQEIGANPGETTDPYFLGTLVLIKPEDGAEAKVVDGQQRLTTLTILWAALRARLQDGDAKRKLYELYNRPKGSILKKNTQPRLKLWESERAFFEKYVQSSADFSALSALNPDKIDDEVQRRIRANAALLAERVADNLQTDEEIKRFCEFLLTRCFLVVVSTPSEKSAFRVFSVLNDRGLSLLPCDIIKARIVGNLGDAKLAEHCVERWNRFEKKLGRKSFNELFAHILMTKRREKIRTTMLEHFLESVLLDKKPPRYYQKFFDDELTRFVRAYIQLKNGKLENAGAKNTEIGFLLLMLNRIEFSDWIPPALEILRDFQRSASQISVDEVLLFFQKLERLSAYLSLCSQDVNRRIERFARVLRGFDDGSWPDEIELAPDEQRKFYDVLDGDFYNVLSSKKRAYLLLRLDSFYVDTSAVYDAKILTVEHILPQTATSEYWKERWPDEDERRRWLHRLGNLVPLSVKKNSQAQNFDFPTKLKTYFFKGDASAYALTQALKDYSDWTPEIVARRQEELMQILAERWELQERDVDENVPAQKSEHINVRRFQLDFWTKFRDKWLAAGATSFQKPRPFSGAEIRFGKSGASLSLSCNATQNFAAIKIYVAPYKIGEYLPVLESVKSELEGAAERSVNWNANPNGKARVVELERFVLDATNPENVETVLDQMVDAARKYRRLLKRAFKSENDEGAYSLESYPFSEKSRLLYDAFHDALTRRFPSLKRVFKKLYIAYKTSTNVVDVEPQKKTLLLTVNLKFAEVADPEGVCFDLTDKGRFGNGDVGVRISDVSQIEAALEIVAQSFAKRSPSFWETNDA